MNAKSIRLEALRFASALNPGDTSNLLSSAHDIEGFIQGINPSDSPLYNRLDHLEKLLYNLQPKPPAGDTSRDFLVSSYDTPREDLVNLAERIRQKEGRPLRIKLPTDFTVQGAPTPTGRRKPGPKPNPARKGSAKRTAARKRASA